MPRSAQARLDDMPAEIAAISAAILRVSFDAFQPMWYLRAAVER